MSNLALRHDHDCRLVWQDDPDAECRHGSLEPQPSAGLPGQTLCVDVDPVGIYERRLFDRDVLGLGHPESWTQWRLVDDVPKHVVKALSVDDAVVDGGDVFVTYQYRRGPMWGGG